MRSAEGGGFSARSDDRNDGEDSIVSELVSLIEHARASMKLIESALRWNRLSVIPELPPRLSCRMTSRLVTKMQGRAEHVQHPS